MQWETEKEERHIGEEKIQRVLLKIERQRVEYREGKRAFVSLHSRQVTSQPHMTQSKERMWSGEEPVTNIYYSTRIICNMSNIALYLQ